MFCPSSISSCHYQPELYVLPEKISTWLGYQQAQANSPSLKCAEKDTCAKELGIPCEMVYERLSDGNVHLLTPQHLCLIDSDVYETRGRHLGVSGPGGHLV